VYDMQYTNIKMSGDEATVRFVLRKEGAKPLVVIGINPSTANESKPDRTMSRVMGFAEGNGFDSFIMLNLYPQRTPRPAELHQTHDEDLHHRNIEEIKSVLTGFNSPSVLLTFGDNIGCRSYLRDCLKDIVEVISPLNPQWLHAGSLTKSSNPRHPLYVPYCTFEKFDINSLIK